MAPPVRRASPFVFVGAVVGTVALGVIALPAGAIAAAPSSTTTSTTANSTTTSTTIGTTTTTTAITGTTVTTTPASTTSTTSPALGAAQLLSSALGAASKQRAVKWTENLSMDGVTISLQASSGKADGLRSETISDGAQSGQVSTILDGGVAYVRGNYLGLRALMDFTDAAATGEAGRWIYAQRAKPAEALVYYSMASGLTVSSLVAQLPMLGTLTEAPLSVVHGQHVYGVKGDKALDAAVPEVLYVRATGSHLPVELTSSYKGANATLVFGAWGQPPSVSAPPKAVPLAASWMSVPAG